MTVVVRGDDSDGRPATRGGGPRSTRELFDCNTRMSQLDLLLLPTRNGLHEPVTLHVVVLGGTAG